MPISTHLESKQTAREAITTWSKQELRKMARANDLHIAPFREDGARYGSPTWI